MCLRAESSNLLHKCTGVCEDGSKKVCPSVVCSQFTFSTSVGQIHFKLGENVLCGRVKQSCSLGGTALNPWFLTNFSIRVLIGLCIQSYWLLCKSMGIAMLNHMFDFFSKTVSQIHFKLGGDMPWVGLYQVCSNGHGPMIYGFLGRACPCPSLSMTIEWEFQP